MDNILNIFSVLCICPMGIMLIAIVVNIKRFYELDITTMIKITTLICFIIWVLGWIVHIIFYIIK